jgi:hypothetical protein
MILPTTSRAKLAAMMEFAIRENGGNPPAEMSHYVEAIEALLFAGRRAADAADAENQAPAEVSIHATANDAPGNTPYCSQAFTVRLEGRTSKEFYREVIEASYNAVEHAREGLRAIRG